MAMLGVGLLKSPSTILSLGYSSHNENKFVKRGVRLPSLRKGSHHIGVSVKCLKELPLPSFNDTLTFPVPKDNATTLPYPFPPPPPPPPQVEKYYVVRRDFPPDFKFGASTSALQTEGALSEGGRGPSTWDFFVKDPETGKEIAVDSYHKYKEDVKCLKEMGVNAYRFSISWSRILPKGSLFGGINMEGIEFYNNLINELLANGITPFVTLHHFDLPQALQDQYGGFLNPNIVNDFKAYANICFHYFGDRVKHWTTINEPQGVAVSGDKNDRFRISHNIILAHAAVAKHYKENFQKDQNGEIGISLICLWAKPSSDSSKDISAAKRANDFMLGWYLNPLVYGDYPYIMRNLLGDELPIFTEEEKELVKGAYDFIGLNYYTSRYADYTEKKENSDPPKSSPAVNEMFKIPNVNVTVRDGENHEIGEKLLGSGNVYIYPDGLKESLIYIKNEYKDPKIYITENGVPEPENGDDNIPLEKALEDDHRISFIRDHINALHEALKEGAKVDGYFVWSLMDGLEWGSGYKVRMGLIFIDYNDNLKRLPKNSAKWLRHFLTDILPPAGVPIHPIKPIPEE